VLSHDVKQQWSSLFADWTSEQVQSGSTDQCHDNFVYMTLTKTGDESRSVRALMQDEILAQFLAVSMQS
jgi:hypothetical protein